VTTRAGVRDAQRAQDEDKCGLLEEAGKDIPNRWPHFFCPEQVQGRESWNENDELKEL
jgi:hypothetical protein